MERIELGGFDMPMNPSARADGGADERAGMRLDGRGREGGGMRPEGHGEKDKCPPPWDCDKKDKCPPEWDCDKKDKCPPEWDGAPMDEPTEPQSGEDAGEHEGAAIRLDVGDGRGSKGETHVYFGPFEQNKAVTISDDCGELNGAGRVLDVAVKLEHVSPHRRVALGISVNEVDKKGREHSRGFRSVTVPAHHEKSCCERRAPVVRFILPEDLRPEGHGGVCSGRRHFIIRTDAQYVDGNADC